MIEDKLRKDDLVEKFRKWISQSTYTDKEYDLIATLFADNEKLLMALRKHFLQGELTEAEQSLIKGFASKPDAMVLLRKTLIPEINPEAPVGQLVDLWISIDTKNKLAEDAHLEMKAKRIFEKYLYQQFEILESGETISKYIALENLIYDGVKNSETAFIDMQARNTLLQHIDGLFHFLMRTAVQTETKLTAEGMSEKLKKDSNK